MEDSETIDPKNLDSHISINKSTYKRLLVTVVSVAIVSAFLGGYIIGSETTEPKEITIRETLPNSQTAQTAQENFGPQIIRNISLDDDPMKGNPNALITIIEFSDFQCPFCAKFHESTLPQLEQQYISTGKVNFVYRDFPIQSIHPNAVPAALASECADDQGKFWEIHDLIFQNQRNWQDLPLQDSAKLFKQYAVQLGLDIDEFDSCMTTGKHFEEIQKDLNDGRNYGVTGTPGFFVGNEEIGFTKLIGAQPFSSFQRVIDGQLNR